MVVCLIVMFCVLTVKRFELRVIWLVLSLVVAWLVLLVFNCAYYEAVAVWDCYLV